MVSCSVSVMVRFWMGFVSLEVDMGTYLRVEEYEGFGWCVLISGGLLFVAMLLRDGKALWLLAVVKALVSPISCPICCEALENLDHLLFCCDLAKDIARFNQVQNKCWKECFTLPGGVSGHIETISSSLIQIFEKMVFLKT
ncbi:hypothetical protein Tco_0885695 [Tanacetum coccineum]